MPLPLLPYEVAQMPRRRAAHTPGARWLIAILTAAALTAALLTAGPEPRPATVTAEISQ